MSPELIVQRLRARRAELARLHAQVDAVALLDEVLGLLARLEESRADLDTKRAGGELGISSRVLERWCRAGKVPGAYRSSGETGQWRIPRAALEAVRQGRAALTGGVERE